jgi:hypothetical protein
VNVFEDFGPSGQSRARLPEPSEARDEAGGNGVWAALVTGVRLPLVRAVRAKPRRPVRLRPLLHPLRAVTSPREQHLGHPHASEHRSAVRAGRARDLPSSALHPGGARTARPARRLRQCHARLRSGTDRHDRAPARSCQYWNTASSSWAAMPGCVTVLAGTSSRNLLLTARISQRGATCRPAHKHHRARKSSHG